MRIQFTVYNWWAPIIMIVVGWVLVLPLLFVIIDLGANPFTNYVVITMTIYTILQLLIFGLKISRKGNVH